MWHQMLVPTRMLIIPVLIITTKGQAPKNHSDVIVTYSNHAEAEPKVEPSFPKPVIPEPAIMEQAIPEPKIPGSREPKVKLSVPLDISSKLISSNSSDEYLYSKGEIATVMSIPESKEDVAQDDVVFVPNEREYENNGYQIEGTDIRHIMGGYRTVEDVKKKTPSTTEIGDTIFITGKNHEIEDKAEKERPSNKGTYVDAPYGEETTKKPKIKLNCNNLDCDNQVQSVCGAKIENKKWRYRLFLNDCYFRKVNCNFRNAENRFKKVDLDFCPHVGVHHIAKPDPRPTDTIKIKPVQVVNVRRSGSSRRSMSLNVDGNFCSHSCPSICPDHYEPECAVTSKGEYRMFLNHCQLDLHSCSYRTMWRKRPLSECVGRKKADVQHNRGFIDWMQRAGIVDKKGRLVLS